MKTTEYLYGKSITELIKMDEALKDRIQSATQLLHKLLEVPLDTRDFTRINAVLKAIEHNNKILHGMI